ncbi:MAG: carboxypeptidase regulatory-like domain-containing protein [Pirellulales bacterium]|nr:carboxypeptidase regulatory-like domain-containing protein [Pirellulales bacterium]
MSWIDRLTRRPSALNVRPDADRAIDEELMFHLRSLVEDQMTHGVPFDEAWERAQQRFGSLRQYSDACRRESWGGMVLWRAGIAVGLALMVLLGTWLAVGMRSMRLQQEAWQTEMLAQGAAATAGTSEGSAELPPRTNLDVKGGVVDQHGAPLADARILVILKTWPGGRFFQENFSTSSDAHGRFRLAQVIPERGQYAVLVSAVKSGFALKSAYTLVDDGAVAEQAGLQLSLETAMPVTLVIRDANGRPVPNALVAPHSRQPPVGDEQLIYWMAREPVQTLTDVEGRVTLDCFRTDDQAEIFLQIPGRDWEEQAFRVGSAAEIIVTSHAPALSES